MKTDVPRPIRLENYRPPEYLIDTVELNFTLDPTRTRVMSRLEMRPNPDAAKKGQPLSLDGENLELGEVRLDGKKLKPIDYQVTDRHLIIPRVPQKPFTLEIETFVNPEANKALQGLYRSRGIYCTQCEPEGFRRITYFLDRPDVLAVYTTRIEADAEEAPVLLSNGNPIERGTIDGGKRQYAVWKDPFPKPSYLFALVGGNLSAVTSTFRTKSAAKSIWPFTSSLERKPLRLGDGFAQASMRWDEERFGLDTISTYSTSSPCPTSTWARWRTRGLIFSTIASFSFRLKRRRMPFTKPSNLSSRTNTSTIGPATALPVAIGFSSA